MAVQIRKSTLTFLKNLSKNNYSDDPQKSRDWFAIHKQEYQIAQENMLEFADALLLEMRKHDQIDTASGKSSLYRIYRDTRFSKDKTPYKTHFGGGFRRATKKLRGGYYFQVGPGESLAAGGFFNPNPEDLLRIRQDIDYNHESWKKVLGHKTMVKTFGKLRGEQVLTSPKGFSKDHPAIELLRYKQLYLERSFSDDEVLSPHFVKELNQSFKNLRPYFDHMSELLTTDGNGELR